MEFVDVNQDEIPGETWDSFESSDFYEHLENGQTQSETAASSTTKTNPPKWTGKRFIYSLLKIVVIFIFIELFISLYHFKLLLKEEKNVIIFHFLIRFFFEMSINVFPKTKNNN